MESSFIIKNYGARSNFVKIMWTKIPPSSVCGEARIVCPFRHTDWSLEHVFDNWWKETYSAPPTIAMEVDHMETCKEMVSSGFGYAIIPDIGLNESEDMYRLQLRTKHGEPILRKSWMIYRKESLHLSLIKAFVIR